VRRYDDIDVIKLAGSASVTRRRTIATLPGAGKSFAAGVVQVSLAQLFLVQSVAMVCIFDWAAEIDCYKPPTSA
jgi:hypothetical protein